MNAGQIATLAVYTDALREGTPDRLIRRLAADAVFISPFSSWTAGADVRAAYQARALAVTDVTVTSSAAGDDVGVVAWRGRTGQYTCEGVDILTLTAAGAIARADVFLRPADVLAEVRQAMAAAWPRLPASAKPGGFTGATPAPQAAASLAVTNEGATT